MSLKKDHTINLNSSIIEAIKKIDFNKKQFVAVIDDKLHLKGTITDGDIRRGFLNGYSTKESVENIMNKNPTYQRVGFDIITVNNLMKIENIKQCPIVDDNNILKEIIFINHSGNKKINNTVVIMAGGLGIRMKPITDELPKAMIKVKGRPMLEHIIENLRDEGFINFLISVNYKSEIIKDYFQKGDIFGVNIDYLEEDKRLGTAGPLSLINDNKKVPYLVLNCDLITNISYQDLIEYHQKNNSKATMAIKRYEKNIPHGVIGTKGKEIVSFNEKPVHQYDINAGIYVFDYELFKYIPKNTYYDMTEYFDLLIKEGIKPIAFPIYESWNDLTAINDIKKINNL